MDNDKYQVLYHVADLYQTKTLSTLKLNIASWFYKAPKFDMRYWDSKGEIDSKAGKGIVLTLDEMRALKSVLDQLDLDTLKEDFSNYGECIITSNTTLTEQSSNNTVIETLPWE